jgi:hypothetical protein
MGDTGRARTSPLLAVVAIALVVVGLGALVAAGTWIFRSAAAIKWAAIATGGMGRGHHFRVADLIQARRLVGRNDLDLVPVGNRILDPVSSTHSLLPK